MEASANARPSGSPLANPWVQLILGVICTACVSNLQYGWTLFVDPIDAKYHWGRSAIQVAFTIFVLIEDPEHWQLIINKQTHQWGLTYNQGMDLGRVKMSMSKPAAKIETYKMTLSSTGADTGKLQLEWDNYVASVPIKVT